MVALSAADTAKIALLIGAFAGVYGLSRWASRQTESVPRLPEPPLENRRPVPLDSPRNRSNVLPIDSRPQFARTEVVDEEALLPIRIVKLYFSRFDMLPGPPDPSSFADEIFVELYNENTGDKWTQSYFVSSGRGLEQMLEEEHWQYAFADQSFFVRRYDARAIRQMIVEQLVATQEKPRPAKEEDRYL